MEGNVIINWQVGGRGGGWVGRRSLGGGSDKEKIMNLLRF